MLQPQRLFRCGVARFAQPLVGENFACHGKARSLACVRQVRRLARVDRIDDWLLDADGKRVARLRVPGIARVPMPGDSEVDDLLLAARERPGREGGAYVLRRLEQFWQPDIGMVGPADDAARLLGRVVDARLLGVHVGAVDDGDARHAIPPAGSSCMREASIVAPLAPSLAVATHTSRPACSKAIACELLCDQILCFALLTLDPGS